ncbi:MAG: hypothetical protein K2P88_09270 [Chitinophagaceae bacterium]|uniref:CcoQ/FixQ family Cbb3-type cytochrome c oxidase assembly chaperone n=1 Tax=unclassified Paraflavitalea TaxID=2798305 RepID=UPI003D35628A|nr:hypothetical protein [Chitinophagaceae bacterium]
MKFVHYLEKIRHVDVYALSSFAIFAAIFLAALVYVVKTPKKTFDKLSEIPLD